MPEEQNLGLAEGQPPLIFNLLAGLVCLALGALCLRQQIKRKTSVARRHAAAHCAALPIAWLLAWYFAWKRSLAGLLSCAAIADISILSCICHLIIDARFSNDDASCKREAVRVTTASCVVAILLGVVSIFALPMMGKDLLKAATPEVVEIASWLGTVTSGFLAFLCLSKAIDSEQSKSARLRASAICAFITVAVFSYVQHEVFQVIITDPHLAGKRPCIFLTAMMKPMVAATLVASTCSLRGEGGLPTFDRPVRNGFIYFLVVLATTYVAGIITLTGVMDMPGVRSAILYVVKFEIGLTLLQFGGSLAFVLIIFKILAGATKAAPHLASFRSFLKTETDVPEGQEAPSYRWFR